MGSLVTGIGYIGSRLVEMLLAAGQPVVGLDNLFSTDPDAIARLTRHPGFHFLRGDAADAGDVRQAFRTGIPIETVYHLAAQASASPEAAPIEYTERANLVAPRVVLEQAIEAGAATFVLGGSLQVYGREVRSRVDETSPYGPMRDIPHLSKIYVEKLMEMFSHARGLRCVSARLGLVYGLSPVMKTDPRFMTAPNKFCLQATRGEPIRVDPSGLNPTSLIHVEDSARGLIALSRWPREGYQPVNLIGETATIAQVAELVRRLAQERGIEVGLTVPAETAGVPPDPFTSVMAEVGFSPRRRLEEGLREVLAHFLSVSEPSPSGEVSGALRGADSGEGIGIP